MLKTTEISVSNTSCIDKVQKQNQLSDILHIYYKIIIIFHKLKLKEIEKPLVEQPPLFEYGLKTFYFILNFLQCNSDHVRESIVTFFFINYVT